MGSNETKLSDFESAKHQKLIAALLENHSLDAAFKATGISRNTGYRWIGTPEFQKAYRQARGRIVQAVIGRLQSMGAKALAAIEAVLDDSQAAPAVKVQAGRAVLDLILRAHEVDQLEGRLEALEAALKDRDVLEGQVAP